MLVSLTGIFGKHIAVFSPESVQAVRWLPRAEHSPRERKRDRQTDRQTDRQAGRQIETQTDTHRHTETESD